MLRCMSFAKGLLVADTKSKALEYVRSFRTFLRLGVVLR